MGGTTAATRGGTDRRRSVFALVICGTLLAIVTSANYGGWVHCRRRRNAECPSHRRNTRGDLHVPDVWPSVGRRRVARRHPAACARHLSVCGRPALLRPTCSRVLVLAWRSPSPLGQWLGEVPPDQDPGDHSSSAERVARSSWREVRLIEARLRRHGPRRRRTREC